MADSLAAPDPGVRHYGTGLLPQVMTPKRTVATWRTRSSALATPARRWVRCVFYPNRFPLANPLPSTASADSFEPLFGDFFGSMELSDFPCSFITGVCPQTSQCGLLPPWLRANMGSPGSRVRCFHACARSSTAQGPEASRFGDTPGIVFRIVPRRRHPGFKWISRLNTWPACTPVNASTAAWLPPPHDSGPVWFATPSPYGSFIHDTLPVFPALSSR